MSVYDKLKALNISLPALAAPVAAFVPYTRVDKLLYTSGNIAKKDGHPWVGKLGAGVSVAEGQEAARSVAIDLLATLQVAVGDLNAIRIVKLMVLVNSTLEFTEQHLVANGASELFVAVFGERGQHARSAFGVAQVPLGACVEIELIAEVG